ncbi:MAG: Pecanex-like protein 1 [Actinomycetota bacterium]|nr:Pecanex-like protein 1 [Actinomycetota bacterium]
MVAGIALMTGSASAHNHTGGDLSAAVLNSAAGPGDRSDDRRRDRNRNRDRKRDRDNGNADDGNAQKQAGHDHGSDRPTSDRDNENRKNKPNNGLEILGTDCANSGLEPHNGFQDAPRCVRTSFGEVSAADKNPSLLITSAPRKVRPGERFTITVSSRNLVRDRFLAAADGGYYLERSELNDDGLQRGHFHTACRMLGDTNVAPEPDAEPAAFIATEDGRGGARPDTVRVRVPGLPGKGVAQCAVWAGDGSHRIPMMQRANQTPAFDAVRIAVE